MKRTHRKRRPSRRASGATNLCSAQRALLQAGCFIAQFPRAEIEADEVKPALARLQSLSESAEVARALADRVIFSVTGYDDDPRALCEVPECRRYFRQLASAWDGWGHYLEKQHGSFKTFLSLLVDVEIQYQDAIVTRARPTDPLQIERVLVQLFLSTNKLYEHLGLGEPALKAMSDSIAKQVHDTFSAHFDVRRSVQ